MPTIEKRVENFRDAVRNYDIFDMNIWWAPSLTDAFVRYDDWARQLDDLAQFGINGGIVTAHNAAFYDPYVGNEELLPLLRANESFYGSIVVTPDMFLNPQKGRDYLSRMREAKVVAARMYPGQYKHSVREYAIGKMCRALEEAKLPLIVWHIDTSWDEIDSICTDHPGLNVVLESMDRKLLYHARDDMALLQAHKNFYLETHNLVLFRELETLYALGGQENLIYGSYFPYMTPNFSTYPVYMAEIPESAKRAVFAGNAKRLFGIDRSIA